MKELQQSLQTEREKREETRIQLELANYQSQGRDKSVRKEFLLFSYRNSLVKQTATFRTILTLLYKYFCF